ncbi:uncharacterized protein LOC111614059 [Centruroides sculpturatus]|uniref:uncharacterized protein LOC111614059 n=1 Tax=Centruroides sculpturatus TaxID=218467 RepID=UPI000C6D0FD6|nr:uncharacterized protein LOC111614059 [Centruroides sculpturatus]
MTDIAIDGPGECNTASGKSLRRRVNLIKARRHGIVMIAPTPKLENISKCSYNSTFENTETFLNNKMLDVITISDDENSDSINISNNKPVCYDTIKSSSKIPSASTKESDFMDMGFQTSFESNKRLTALEEKENLFSKERSVCSKENKNSIINLNQFLTDKVFKFI